MQTFRRIEVTPLLRQGSNAIGAITGNGWLNSESFNVLLAGVSYCDGTYRIERKPENLYSFEYIYSGKGMLVIDG